MEDIFNIQVEQTRRNIDIVFCIDGTGSMGGCIENVKNHAREFKHVLEEALKENNTFITALRCKIIVFRDYGVDMDAMVESKFFDLMQGRDQSDFEKTLNGIEARGGGDSPENGLEALYYAMTSDFTYHAKDRQIILMFTDTDALPLLERKGNPYYPDKMVDFDGLQNIWAGASGIQYSLGQRQKRMILFAPEGTIYEDMASIFNLTFFKPVKPGNGMNEIEFDTILNEIVRSVG